MEEVKEENDLQEDTPLLLNKKATAAGATTVGKLSDLPQAPKAARPDITEGDGQPSASLSSLLDTFGGKLLVMLFTTQHLMKGFAAGFTGPSVQYLFAAYKVHGPQMQIFASITNLPWAMKPMIGLASDAVPIFGYHKAPYIIIASLSGAAACALIGVVPQAQLSVLHLVGCLFLLQLQFSTCDLLTEAKYSEKMQTKPKHGPALMTYVWFGMAAAGLIATVLVGPVLQHFGPKVPFLIALIPSSAVLVPVLLNYMEETPASAEAVAAGRQRLAEQKEACVLCFLMLFATLTLTALGFLFESAVVNATAALVVALVMLVAFSVALNPIIAKVNAFFLVQTSLNLSIGGAAFYFYTDTPTQFPDGPHFSMEFFTSILGIVSSICTLIGIWSYQTYASNWTYRGLMLVSNVAASVLSLTDVVLFTRLNKSWGIPDHAFVLGSSVFSSVIMQWMWMPGVVLLAQLCPKGMEATMYALLAGCHNLGSSISSSCGALVLQWFNCQPSGAANETEQFEYLWVASAVSTVLPMLTLVLIPVLIPNARQTDKLLKDEQRHATSGSLWRRWTGVEARP